ncbi:uncharacterized protein LOC105683261 [Athalia rosae]|uniref:uncharacterized protein LOC105683261 n=1 Tax=Athalia rosae TaxID=37344 RepID=UPI000626AF68|nr:uncharacterized protein LOC105683261 [Athalia rosae]
MAFYVKRNSVKHVPWFSLSEWHDVYKQIYSSDTGEQKKGYERLLVWKARLPKMPVGAECTLSIIQVCLRDRELTPKIDSGELPAHYENDLRLMYSTTIMRFLNQISNIGHTKQSSLFQIAKQLKIPQWIVNIRHDAAHGDELPSISVLRIAINILLEWLHEEYWAAETKAMEAAVELAEALPEPDEVQILMDLIELWIAIGLYIHAGCSSIKDIPDAQLKKTLSDFGTYTINSSANDSKNSQVELNGKDNTLITGQNILLAKISRYLSKNKLAANKDEVVLNILINRDVFLPSEESLEIFNKQKSLSGIMVQDSLSPYLTRFWQDFIMLLHDKDMLQTLILSLLNLVNDENQKQQKRLTASLWLQYIASSLCKIKIAHNIKHCMEHAHENNKKKTSPISFVKVQEEVDQNYPEYKNVSWLNVSGDIPSCLTDRNYVTEILCDINKFSTNFVTPILQLVTPSLSENTKGQVFKFIQVYTGKKVVSDQSLLVDDIKTVDDFVALAKAQNGKNLFNEKFSAEIGDQTNRHSIWLLELETQDWSNCLFGILPWQLESMNTMNTFGDRNSVCSLTLKESDVLPGMIDERTMTVRSRINWNSILGKKKKPKRKRSGESQGNMVHKAMRIASKNC